MSNDPLIELAKHTEAIDGMREDIAEIKADLKSFLKEVPRECESRRVDIYKGINKNNTSLAIMQTKTGIIAALATLITNAILGFIMWFGFFKRLM